MCDELFLKNLNNDTEYFGSITNKVQKLDILLTKKSDDVLNFEMGNCVEITGDLQKSGKIFKN